MKRQILGLALTVAAFSPTAVGAQGIATITPTEGTQGMPTGSVERVALVRQTDSPPADALYRDPKQPIEARVEDLMKRLTPEEKARMVHASSGSSSGNLPRVGLANVRTLDGPNGTRADRPVTYFPSAIAYAATWDMDLVEEIARTLGKETRAVYKTEESGARMLLGPGANIARTPLGARNFEYFGEDPLLSGKTAAAYCRGLQSVKVSPCMKHWVLNDQEWCRTVLDVDVPDRALHEIYAKPFEIAVREAGVWAVMGSYNAVRGHYSSHSSEINDLLRSYGFDGAIYSDWGGWHGDVPALNGGATLESGTGQNAERDRRNAEQVAKGIIRADRFEDAVRRNLRNLFRMGAFDTQTAEDKAEQAAYERDFRSEAHRRIARKAAVSSAVLLKNKDGFLPLNREKIRTVALIGPNADQTHSMIGGVHLKDRGGSGAVLAAREVTPLMAFVEAFGKENVLFAPGFRFENTDRKDAVSVPGMPAMDPVEAARRADVVIFCGGLDHSLDREVLGWGHINPSDRPNLELKGPQAELIKPVAAVNPRTVVALTIGAPVSVEAWEAAVPAVLVTWYSGEEGGNALVDLLFGKENPSGKLPYTFGKQLEDWPCHRMGPAVYPGVFTPEGPFTAREYYADGIWVGYRGFDQFKREPRYPFGFGLSYTTFAISEAPSDPQQGIFRVKVRNTGARAGREVVQCYVSKPKTDGEGMPVKELVAFASVTLAPGEERVVELVPSPDAYRYWSEKANGWRPVRGECVFRIGNSSANLPVRYTVRK